ncbi:MAG: hypothetical protein KA163_00815 [Bacteroidia bacterium]|nr:hypothetical protein [Bacteroidia bacterium]
MKFIFSFIFCLVLQSSFAQLTCESIKELGVIYKGTTHRNGRTRLFPTDTAIHNRMQYYKFELQLAGNLSAEDKSEIAKYKIKFNPNDTVMIYDWDIMHQGKMAYHGKAIAKIKINCADSMITVQKYLLKKETVNYVPNRFKIFKINEKDFMISDRNHSYLNINMYFTKD